MMKIFLMLVRKFTTSTRSAAATHDVTIICRTTTNSIHNKNYKNDSAIAGSLYCLHIPVSQTKTNSNLFTKTLLQYFKKSGLVLSLLLVAVIFSKQGIGQGSQTFSTAGSSTFIVPAGVSSITVETWGAGGKGGSTVSNSTECGGGGGGAYSRSVLAVGSGNSYTIKVGAGSTGTNPGDSSYLKSTGFLVLALGGNSAANNSATGVTGGAAANGVGDFKFSGGTGANGSDGNFGGGGGSSAGTAANGVNGSGVTGGTAPSGGGNGGNGGPSNPSNGNPGIAPGGGGGGVRSGGGTQTGGSGADGRVKISWTCPAATISYNFSTFCKSITSAPVVLTGSTGGSFSSTAGLSINSSSGTIDPSASTPGTYVVHYQIASAGGCSAVNATATITINGTPVTSVVGHSDINCFAGNDGSITISVTGGTSPYFYSVNNGTTWTATASPSPFTYGGLVANTQYRIKVKDSNGCESK